MYKRQSLFYPQRTIGLAGQASLAFAESGRNGGTMVNVDNDDVVEELRAPVSYTHLDVYKRQVERSRGSSRALRP